MVTTRYYKISAICGCLLAISLLTPDAVNATPSSKSDARKGGIVAMKTESSRKTVGAAYRLYFKVGSCDFDPEYRDNRKGMQLIETMVRRGMARKDADRFPVVVLVGAASPEESVDVNRELSMHRALEIYNRLKTRLNISDSQFEYNYVGRNWEDLLAFVKKDSRFPHRDATIALLSTLVEQRRTKAEVEEDGFLNRFKALKGGEPYRYAYDHYFTELRNATLSIKYVDRKTLDKSPSITRLYGGIKKRASSPTIIIDRLGAPSIKLAADPVRLPDALHVSPSALVQNVYVPADTLNTRLGFDRRRVALSTNLLADAALLPNLGAEVAIARQWSLMGSWTYGWWSEKHSRFVHAYGGDLGVRYWFGPSAAERTFAGHHIGVYGQGYVYDVKTGLHGKWSDGWNFGAGVEYGYSLPVSSRFNLDFFAGLGYFGGSHKEYRRYDGCDIWEGTRRINWWGPTRIGVSLVFN